MWCLALAAVAPASAWNSDGHQIVAQIAVARMQPETLAALERLTGAPVRQALAVASVWPDGIVGSRPETRPWHYVNIPARADGFDWLRDCPEAACVVGALQTQWARLRDADLPVEARREALAFVVHLVADLHQPLHAGDGQDRGGNDITVEVDGQRSNLHRLMDGEFFPWPELFDGSAAGDGAVAAERERVATTPERERIATAPVGERVAMKPLARRDIVEWAEDSHRLAVESIYASLPPPRPDRVRVIGPSLHDRFWRLARQRVLLAGERLAKVLDAAMLPR